MRGQFWDLHEAFGCGVGNAPCTEHAGHTQGHLGETSTPGVPGSTSVCGRACAVSVPVVSDSLRPRQSQPARSPVPGILQARTLEWAAIPSSRGPPTSPVPPAWAGESFATEPPAKPPAGSIVLLKLQAHLGPQNRTLYGNGVSAQGMK